MQFSSVQFHYSPFDLNLPALDIKVVNNGKETLFLSGALLEVDQSEVDREPVIIIPADSYGRFAGYILLENDGWGDVEKPVLRFNVAPSNPDDWTVEDSFAKPPAGTLGQWFTNEIRCKSFSEPAQVDIAKALDDAGANIERLSELEWIENGARVVTHEKDEQHETFTPEEYDRELKKALGPFADNLARVEREIDYETGAAPAGKRTVRFCTFVRLYNERRKGKPLRRRASTTFYCGQKAHTIPFPSMFHRQSSGVRLTGSRYASERRNHLGTVFESGSFTTVRRNCCLARST